MDSKLDKEDLLKWKDLLKIAAISLWTILAFVVVQVVVYAVNPPPVDVIGFFNLYQRNPLLGLLSLDLIMLLDWVLEIPVFLALYVVLRRKSESWMLLATTMAMVGIAIYFGSGVAFEMLAISNQYALATTEIQKQILLSAGETLLATYEGTAFNVSYVMVAVAFLIASMVMLKSESFGKKTAYVGIAMAVLMLLPPTAGVIGFVCSFLSLIPMMVWFVIVGNKFNKLSIG